MRGTCNVFFDVGQHFSKLKKQIEPLLYDVQSMTELILVVEKILIKNLQERHKNRLVFDAMAEIILKKGNLKAGELAKEMHICNRQLERLFQENIGVTPKKMASMVRYQNLWNDILYRQNCKISDLVYQYGYTDQAHLLRDFKRFHSMNLTEAKKHALKDVVFLQD